MSIQHISRQIPPIAHTSMYLWHKFWSRKTWNVVSEYIKTYCPTEGIVFDPFAGSGITALEALKNNRRVIACDINPLATEIIRCTAKMVSEKLLYDAFDKVKQKVKVPIYELYTTVCRSCGKKIVFDCAIWEKGICREVRYQACPYCGDRKEKNCELLPHDEALLRRIDAKPIKEWYPRNAFYYPDGRPFKEKQKYESVDELFTKRNLQSLALLMKAIQEEPSDIIRDFLKIAFSSMVHLCSKMCPISEAGHFTPFSSAWIHHSYWYPSGPCMEQNVWDKFEMAINGHQGLLKAKVETNKLFSSKKIASSLQQVFDGKADIYIYKGSCLDLMNKMPGDSIDYIFTDPPYDASIQYGELTFMWICWLGMDKGFIGDILTNEVIRNERQHKDFDVYQSLLSASFKKMFNVLKTGRYLTLTFHNPTFKVRNMTIRSGIFAGFEFEKIHHQELARPSAKSLLQPFGSAQGDFYLRFKKGGTRVTFSTPEDVAKVRFEKIVVDTTIKLLAERSEPTPYTIIINYIDPILAKNGYFSSLHTGMDIHKVLKEHIGKEFILVPAKIGGATGSLWWFKDVTLVSRLNEIPLSERVEQTVYRKLHEGGRVTFTEVWDAVSTEFPNSLTSDSTSIKEALSIYGRQVQKGYWLLKPEIQQRVNQHSEIIAVLASVGKKQGYDIWVGRREQTDKDGGIVSKGKTLREYMTISKLEIKNAANIDVVSNIDLIWIDGDQIVALFEVESTTSMTSALLRGSNVDKDVDKFIIIPEEREAQFNNKLTSPLFRDHYQNENWKLIYFDSLRNAYLKDKSKINVHDIVEKKISLPSAKTRKSWKQEDLFKK